MPQLFYIDIDLRSSRICLAPYQQLKGKAYVIECDSRWAAEQLLKKINARSVKGPMEDPQNYSHVETIKDPLGELRIFRYLGCLT
ncbi:MAG: hypothetical protein HQK50_00640 [Oligoflexia bacterium]|nr:hypothetical protein [Oligoflexia bacterium]MBF0364042.1 hypothetical protein [Oligoflexia bacterium]